MTADNNNTPKIEIVSLSLGFKESSGGEDKVIFSGINAIGRESEMIALIGANGKGKSTLLRSLNSTLPLYRGDILYEGRSIALPNNKRIRDKISFVPSQTPRTKNLSLFDFISVNSYRRSNWLGTLSPDEKERVLEAIRKVGLAGFEKSDSSRLSDGEYQRATIAGALVRESELILLDEPTSFLDISNKYMITGLLKEISRSEKKTIIFSTHDLQLAIQHCDRIWIMGYDSFFDDSPQGHIEKGNFDKIFDNNLLRFNRTTRSFERLE